MDPRAHGFQSWPRSEWRLSIYLEVFGGLLDETVQSVHTLCKNIEISE